jgi:hypothetical protein
MPLFSESRKRLDRAVVHAESVKKIWESLIDPKSYNTVIEMNGDWTEGIVKYVRSSPLPENELAIEFGEMFYQLRAALDHLVYKASVLAEGVDPPSNENRVEFPICIDAAKFTRSTVNDPPFPNQLRDWIEEIQPYNAAKHTGTDLEYVVHALRILHDCARKDRHRRLHVVGAVATQFRWDFLLWPGRLLSVQPLSMNLLEGNNEFLRIKVDGFIPGGNGKIQLNSELISEISIDEIPITKPGESGAALNAVFVAVQQVIEYFEGWHK